MTPLDTAHALMAASPEDPALRLGFYEGLAASELFLLLDEEPTGDAISPRIFETSEGRFVLAFDDEARLSAFAGGAAPYALLPGRGLAGMLAGKGIGIGLNLGVAPSAILLPDTAVAWLGALLDAPVAELRDTPGELFPPSLPGAMVAALDARLARAGGLAARAFLAGVRYRSGRHGHLLALADAAPGAGPALARSIAEAVIFAGGEDALLDVVFLEGGAPLVARLEKVALCFGLPAGAGPKRARDPNRPPRLR